MTPKQIDAVRQSWALVSTLDPVVVGSLFYSRLFQIAPSLKPMFRQPQPEQSRKLLAMLGYTVGKLHKLDDLLDEVQRLAVRHVRYGVQPAHYEPVGEALLWTLQQGLGAQWNPALQEAWATCYAVLSAAMIDASAEGAYA